MFFDFIKAHYELIISVACLLVGVFLAIIKKRPVWNDMDEIKAFILSIIPIFIKEVEKPGNGCLKKDLVLKLVQTALAKKFSFYNFDKVEAFVSDAIEQVLSTPSKKEV